MVPDTLLCLVQAMALRGSAIVVSSLSHARLFAG